MVLFLSATAFISTCSRSLPVTPYSTRLGLGRRSSRTTLSYSRKWTTIADAAGAAAEEDREAEEQGASSLEGGGEGCLGVDSSSVMMPRRVPR